MPPMPRPTTAPHLKNPAPHNPLPHTRRTRLKTGSNQMTCMDEYMAGCQQAHRHTRHTQSKQLGAAVRCGRWLWGGRCGRCSDQRGCVRSIVFPMQINALVGRPAFSRWIDHPTGMGARGSSPCLCCLAWWLKPARLARSTSGSAKKCIMSSKTTADG